MPILTINYFLEAFLNGDLYSAAADARRFRTIDNQMHRVAEFVGDGVIDGWDVSVDNTPSVVVTEGSGLIDNYFVNTQSTVVFENVQEGDQYVFVVRKPDIVGHTGPRSDLANITYTDAGAPASPADFTATAVSASAILLTWTPNTEPDLFVYRLYRSIDDVTFELIQTLDSSVESYSDADLTEDTTYYYRILAVDESSNSSAAATDNATTEVADITPPEVTFLNTWNSHANITAYWQMIRTTPVFNIDYFEIRNVELNTDGSEKPETEEIFTTTNYYYRLSSLNYGSFYKTGITIVDTQGRRSNEASKKTLVEISQAPFDPVSPSYSESEGSENNVIVNLSWDSGDDPYEDPYESVEDPFRYRIYVMFNGVESNAINVPIGSTSYPVSLVPFTGGFQTIPENTWVRFRLTSLNQIGEESNGAILYFKTDVFSPPSQVKNLTAVFDYNNGRIQIDWEFDDRTFGIQIIVVDETTSTTVVSEDIDLTSRYYVSPVTLGDRYAITITPIGLSGVSGDSATVRVDAGETEEDDINGSTELPRIPIPVLHGGVSDRTIVLKWESVSEGYIASYKIYKKTGDVSFETDDWELLDTVPKTTLSFHDYGLENDQKYSYYVTSFDIYDRESLHLPDDEINLNYVELVPRSAGILTEPQNFVATLDLLNREVDLSWDASSEEFDAYILWRSSGDLHSWEKIVTVENTETTYTDSGFPLVDGTSYYYGIEKVVNDAEIRIQSSVRSPENSILIALISIDEYNSSADNSVKRNIANMESTVDDFSALYLPYHKHSGGTPSSLFETIASRIHLGENYEVTEWTTVDGRIWATEEDITAEEYLLKVDGSFPSTFYRIDATGQQIVFSEAISLDSSLRLQLVNVPETQGELPASRILDLNAKQIESGRLNENQLPSLNHDGRIKKELLPRLFLLQRYNDNTFVVPETNSDTTKNFGESVSYFAAKEFNGKINSIASFESYDDGDLVVFNDPDSDTRTGDNILVSDVGVNSDEHFYGNKSYKVDITFVDTDPTRWAHVGTDSPNYTPNPVVDLNQTIRFRILSSGADFYLSLGIREIDGDSYTIGEDGGTTGPIESVGIDPDLTLSDDIGYIPAGQPIQASSEWQIVEFDLKKAPTRSYSGGNNVVNGSWGVLEHLAIVLADDSNTHVIFYIDQIEVVSDVLVAGTSQGLLYSSDFGSQWTLSRYTNTPVHSFYKATNNEYMWALTGNQVFVSRNVEQWFAPPGTTNVQFVRDITEDDQGNMYISTDKGLFFFDIGLTLSLSYWEQLSVVNPVSSQLYAMYWDEDTLFVSTESGIFQSEDNGLTWTHSGMYTENLPVYRFIREGTTLLGITKRHVLRKLDIDPDFIVLYDFYDNHGLSALWDIEYFNDKLYVSTEDGVYVAEDALSGTPVFIKTLPQLSVNGYQQVAFFVKKIISNSDEEQLFVGTENKLLMMADTGIVATKKSHNKEAPSFYIDYGLQQTGFVYNGFNKTLVFREAPAIDSYVYACYLPRTRYFSPDEGWVLQNPYAEVFLSLNGYPVWVDFQLDETQLQLDLASLKDKISSSSLLLTDLNSYYPESLTQANTCVSAIETYQALLAANGTNPQKSQALAGVYESFDRYTSVLNTDFLDTQNLIAPACTLKGISSSERPSDSRAARYAVSGTVTTIGPTTQDILKAVIEASSATESDPFDDAYGAVAESTDISINALEGTVVFPLPFYKTDSVKISVFDTTLSDAGSLSHAMLENGLEKKNTGLTSSLANVCYENLIRLGVVSHLNTPGLFSTYSISPSQTQFFTAAGDDWYDIGNSTVDFESLSSVENEAQPSIVYTALSFTGECEDDPYGPYDPYDPYDPYRIACRPIKLWVGTNYGIVQYDCEASGLLQPTNRWFEDSYRIVYNLYQRSDGTIFAICAENYQTECKIFYTEDFGTTWGEIKTTGLPDRIYGLAWVANRKVVHTAEGIYYCDNPFDSWEKASASLSVLQTDTNGVDSFDQKVLTLCASTMLFAESNRWFYRSGNGVEWLAVGRMNLTYANVVNALYRFKNTTWIGTNAGLFNDSNSILSDAIGLGLQTGLEASYSESAALSITDITSAGDSLFCSATNGKIYRRYGTEPVAWSSYKMEDFGPIQRILTIEVDDTVLLAAISYNKMRVVDVTYGTGVFDA